MSDLMFHQFNGRVIQQRPEDGYFNLTSMCQASGKFVADYLKLSSTKEYLEALSTDMMIPLSALVEVFKGGNSIQGTWAHPEIAIDCAQWCNVQLRIAVNRWIYNWRAGRNQPVEATPIAPKSEYILELELQIKLEETLTQKAAIELEREKLRIRESFEASPAKRSAETVIKTLPNDKPKTFPSCRINIPGNPLPALQMFVDECVDVSLDWGERLTNEEIYKAYDEYCSATYSPRMGSPRFLNELASMLPECREPRRRETIAENPSPDRGWIPAHWARLRIKPHPKAL